jgi:hypothetical protein
MNVLNKIAAHAGIKVCTTKGKDSKAIALANNNVTKNK